MLGVYHTAPDVDRLYALCNEGSRRLRQIESKSQSFIVAMDCSFLAALMSSCQWYRSVILGGPLIQSNAWPVSLLHSCRGVSLKTTSRRTCMEVGQSCLMVFSSKHFKKMQTIPYVQQFSLCTVLEQKTYACQYCHLTEKPPVDMKETCR